MMKPMIAMALVAALASTASADKPAACSNDNAQHSVHVETIGGKRVIVITGDIVICGLQTPSVAYVHAAKNIDYVWESLRQSFLPLIVSSAKKAPL
jgi:hypothetical protein